MQNVETTNLDYWNKEYITLNAESHFFRMYGRILAWEFGLDGSNHEKVLDFGCGSGGGVLS